MGQSKEIKQNWIGPILDRRLGTRLCLSQVSHLEEHNSKILLSEKYVYDSKRYNRPIS